MYFTTKTLVIALAAGAVAMPSKPKMDCKHPGGNSTKPAPPPGGEKEAGKRDFLGMPFPNITDIIKGIGKEVAGLGEEGGEEEPMLPGPPPHGGKNMTKPAPPGTRRVRRWRTKSGGPIMPGGTNMTLPRGLKATKTRCQEGGKDKEKEAEDKEGGAPKKPEGIGAAKPKKPEGGDKPKKPEGSGAPKPPKASGAPKPKKPEGGDKPKKPEISGAPKKPEEREEPVAAAGGPPKPAPNGKPPTPPNGTLAAAGSAPQAPPNGTMSHPPSPKVEGKRTVRGPTSPLRFWA